MLTNNPFTPKSGIEPRFFMNRDKEIEFFRDALKMTEEGRPSHYLVLGGWGCGKTSLLREFKKIAQKEGSLCSFVSIRGHNEKDDLRTSIDYMISEIALRLPMNVSNLKKFIRELNSAGITIVGTGFQFSKEIEHSDPQIFLYLT